LAPKYFCDVKCEVSPAPYCPAVETSAADMAASDGAGSCAVPSELVAVSASDALEEDAVDKGEDQARRVS
jgi:hypothetical protein